MYRNSSFPIFAIAVGLSLAIEVAPSIGSEPPTILSVSGVVADAGIIDITGIDFGAKLTAAPIKFDDFEQGIAGQDLVGWSTSGEEPVYSNEYTRPGSELSAKCQFINGLWLSSFGVVEPSNERFDEIYIDAWYLYEPANPPSRNHKLFRFYEGSDSGLPNLYMNVYCNPNGSAHLSQDGTGASSGDGNQWFGWHWGDSADKSWVHIQCYVKASSIGVADGTAVLMIDGHTWVNRIGDFQTRGSTNSNLWRSVWFGNYLGHGSDQNCPSSPDDSFTYWDAVYVDRTPARVELGNHVDYSLCSAREVQIPQFWNNDNISFRVRSGGFEPGEQVYVFVTNGENQSSVGYGPLQVSGSGDPDEGPPGQADPPEWE